MLMDLAKVADTTMVQEATTMIMLMTTVKEVATTTMVKFRLSMYTRMVTNVLATMHQKSTIMQMARNVTMITPQRPRPPKNTLTLTPMARNATMITPQSPRLPKN